MERTTFKPERQFSNELRGQYSDNLQGASEFHRLPMQAEVKYLCNTPNYVIIVL